MYHMIGCPYVSNISFMIKTGKRRLCEKRGILKRSQYIRIINENFPPNYKVSWNDLKKKSAHILCSPIRCIYQSICSAAFVKHSSWDQAIKRGRACS